MEELLRTYGLWVVLAGVFLAMHLFGVGCGAGQHRGRGRDDAGASVPGGRRQGKDGAAADHRGGCH